MTFWQEFAYTFSEIGWVSAVLLILGLIFVIVELFVPGYGFFGITGSILVIAALVVRAYHHGGGNPVLQVFILLGVAILILGIAAIVLIVLMKKGIFSRTGFVLGRTAVGKERSEGTPDFNDLVGKCGVAKIDLHPVGIAEIDDKQLDVVTRGDYIVAGSAVKVVAVEGGRIVVAINNCDSLEAADNIAPQ